MATRHHTGWTSRAAVEVSLLPSPPPQTGGNVAEREAQKLLVMLSTRVIGENDRMVTRQRGRTELTEEEYKSTL